ncbi:hypothetical protein K9F62_17040 [Desulfovibrio sp. JY]|nr:hypothetical protein K9F62_17040 [Desulfovibrio sp. JY]
MDRANFQLAVDAALVLNYGLVNQAIVKGLNKIGLPELTRDTVTAQEFRRDFDIEFTTTGKFGRITYSGNMLIGDTLGQDTLKQYLKDNAKINSARLYIDYDNFLAPDLANDKESVWQVSKHSPGETDKNGIFSLSGEMTCGGMFAMFVKHQTASTIAFVAAGNTITDTGNGFVTAGFAAGQTLIVEGSTSNNGQFLITAVEAGTLTLDSAVKAVVDEEAGDEVTLHGGTL